MALQFTEHTDPHSFRDVVMPRLLQAEAECCAIIGFVHRLVSNGVAINAANNLEWPLLWTIHDRSAVDLVAVQPFKDRMIVTRGSTQAMQRLAQELAARNWSGKMLIGPTPSIQALAQAYSTLSRRPSSVQTKLRVFDLVKVQSPTPVPGMMRPCEPADRDLLADYFAGYEKDIGESFGSASNRQQLLADADRAINTKSLFFWVDQQPVAMAAWAGPTPNGIRINRVYTPPPYRRRGYATNLVAHLSQMLLDQGRRFCFLFTDLANPVSNSIYQKIGYRPVADSEQWAFAERSAPLPPGEGGRYSGRVRA